MDVPPNLGQRHPVDAVQLAASDKRHAWHPFTQMEAWCAAENRPIVITEGHGAILTDITGRQYIDGNSSIWTNLHGHNHSRINAAIESQLRKISHCSFLGTTNPPAIALAAKLAGLMPPSTLTRVFYSDNGSTAVEVALKMALQFWQLSGHSERTKFAAFEDAYHGDTAGASSLGGINHFTNRFSSIQFPVPRARDFASLSDLDPRTLAAIIIEPLVQGAAGIRLWPAGLLRSLREWCDKNDVLLIFDEVLTGFGRTGRMFAWEHEDVVPDFLCLAKGLSGGYLPLAATLTSEKIFAAFLGKFHERKTFFYGHSYCGNPLACAAALASLEIFREEQTLERLAASIRVLASELDRLREIPTVWEIRQCGFMAGVEVRRTDGKCFPWQQETGAKVCMAARAHGLLTRPILDTIILMPPFCITDSQLKHAVDALKKGILEVCCR